MRLVLHTSLLVHKHITDPAMHASKLARTAEPEQSSKRTPDPRCLFRDLIKPLDRDQFLSIVQMFHFFHCVSSKGYALSIQHWYYAPFDGDQCMKELGPPEGEYVGM